MEVRIDSSWHKRLEGEFAKPYFRELAEAVRKAYRTGVVYPPAKKLFQAFDCCPFDLVKVVILGQDPYHGEGQAEGLAFSVPEGVAPPPSLRNIFKEIADDLGRPSSIAGGSLLPWARAGVLLLNSTLTVAAGQPASHSLLGWERFTDTALATLSQEREGLVFLLWGAHARRKRSLLDASRHLILEAPHPSPLSANRGFLGCRHFSKTNQFLERHGLEPINW